MSDAIKHPVFGTCPSAAAAPPIADAIFSSGTWAGALLWLLLFRLSITIIVNQPKAVNRNERQLEIHMWDTTKRKYTPQAGANQRKFLNIEYYLCDWPKESWITVTVTGYGSNIYMYICIYCTLYTLCTPNEVNSVRVSKIISLKRKTKTTTSK